MDLLQVTVGSWQPDDVRKDLFSGAYAGKAPFLRLDLIVSGLINPPGTIGPNSFNPFRYGPHPIFGFIEIDMDDDASTGGELNAPQFRYLGNVARFGGLMLDDALHDRVALDETAFDDDFTSPPFVERSGEEFHLALFGEQFSRSDIDRSVGDQDDLFEQDEIWTLRGRFFHRAHGYEPFSFAKGGNLPGEYAPIIDALMEGNYFVTSGEVLIPSHEYEGTGANTTLTARCRRPTTWRASSAGRKPAWSRRA